MPQAWTVALSMIGAYDVITTVHHKSHHGMTAPVSHTVWLWHGLFFHSWFC